MLHPMHRYPLPWWLIWHAEALQTATGSVRRITLSLATAYWAGGCSGLPDDMHTQAALTGLHLRSWEDAKPAVMAAFETIRPQLDHEYAAKDAEHLARVRRGQSCIAKVRAKKAARASAAILPNPEHTLPRREQVNVPAHVIVDRLRKASGKPTLELVKD